MTPSIIKSFVVLSLGIGLYRSAGTCSDEAGGHALSVEPEKKMVGIDVNYRND